MDRLESPGAGSSLSGDLLYLYRGADATTSRPVFTGDVYREDDTGRMIMVIQHPCAIRKNGVELVAALLVVPVERSTQKFSQSDWQNRFFRQMPLPDLLEESQEHYSAHFDRPEVISGAELAGLTRVSCMSLRGVNLLLQRWVHHNSRVIVETHAINAATIEQFEEADLVEEWCGDWIGRGNLGSNGEAAAHGWLRSDSGDGRSWQQRLEDPQDRGAVRSAMRAHLRA